MYRPTCIGLHCSWKPPWFILKLADDAIKLAQSPPTATPPCVFTIEDDQPVHLIWSPKNTPKNSVFFSTEKVHLYVGNKNEMKCCQLINMINNRWLWTGKNDLSVKWLIISHSMSHKDLFVLTWNQISLTHNYILSDVTSSRSKLIVPVLTCRPLPYLGYICTNHGARKYIVFFSRASEGQLKIQKKKVNIISVVRVGYM